MTSIAFYVPYSQGVGDGVADDEDFLFASGESCVQISGFSALASNQRHNVAKLALLAVVAGNLACFLSACIAGMLIKGL